VAPFTQILLFVSYAILGLAAMVIPPRLFGLDQQLFGFIGMFIFFGAWQLQNWIIANSTEKDAKTRLDHLEDVTLFLRKDIERTRREVDSRGREGEAKSETLVSELKMLQTLLTQVTRKEAELGTGKGKGKAVQAVAEATEEEALELSVDHMPAQNAEAESAALDSASQEAPISEETASDESANELEFEPSEDEIVTEADIDDLELTPEEAAMVVVDDGGGSVNARDQAAQDQQEGVEPGSAVKTTKKRPPAAAGERGRAGVKRKAPIRLIKREDQLLQVVRSSLSENRVDLYLQPIVGLPSRKTVHFECYSRVRDEEGRIILPRQYLKVAENKGLIGTIDNLLLFRLIQLVRRLGKRRPDLRFFCNMSRYSMMDDEFFPQFIDFMTANREFSNRLVFEISQDDFNALDDDVTDRLRSLGRKGFGFSMDMVKDFHQDFAGLESHYFQFIKADLTDVLIAHPDMGDVEEFKSSLRRKGMQLISSRIESEDMVLKALDVGLEFAQGYLFGEPTAANDMNRQL
jgi:cyclic-di-GMP phosphodiesterase, flagellum assembly factor TipF